MGTISQRPYGTIPAMNQVTHILASRSSDFVINTNETDTPQPFKAGNMVMV